MCERELAEAHGDETSKEAESRGISVNYYTKPTTHNHKLKFSKLFEKKQQGQWRLKKIEAKAFGEQTNKAKKGQGNKCEAKVVGEQTYQEHKCRETNLGQKWSGNKRTRNISAGRHM